MLESPKGVDLVVGLLLFTSSLAAAEQPKSLTPREQYEALLKDYDRASAAWKESGKGLTLADPRWIEHHAAWPKWSFGRRFLQFAEANPKEPEAVEALLQIVGMLGSGHNADRFFFPVMTRAFQMLRTDEGITWRSWWDGGKIGGPIARRWDVRGWPTIIVLDDKGVIRNMHFPHHAHEELADAVDSLLTEMTP